jgi:hypothetical protein
MPLPFEKYMEMAWPFWYQGTLVVDQICGGVPAQENTAEAWIRAKTKDTRSTTEVQALVAETKRQIRETHLAAGRAKAEDGEGDGATLVAVDSLTDLQAAVMDGISETELTDMAIAQAAKDMAGLNMFKRTKEGVLYIEGRQLKAALKEAVSVAANAGKITTKGWGNPDNKAYLKQLKGWFPEHVFVVDKILPLYREGGEPVTREDDVLQKFVHTHRGDAIGYEEAVNRAEVKFTVKTDVDLTEEQWAMIWLTGQDQGLGASRSQGFGTYTVTDWHQTHGAKAKGTGRRGAAKAKEGDLAVASA